MLKPVINGDIAKIGIEQYENTDETLLNPATSVFNKETQLTIRILAEEAWTKMTCDDIEGRFITHESQAEGGI